MRKATLPAREFVIDEEVSAVAVAHLLLSPRGALAREARRRSDLRAAAEAGCPMQDSSLWLSWLLWLCPSRTVCSPPCWRSLPVVCPF